MNRYHVLNYPGAKWSSAPLLLKNIPDHKTYCEPYAGSLALLFSKPESPIEVVNDIDSDIVNLFSCIQKYPEELARLVLTTPYSREVYESQYAQGPSIDSVHQAAGFLIRCWQSYGFRSNQDMVGWKADIHGREKAYALRDWYRLPDEIIATAERLRKVQIEHRPALRVIQSFAFPDVFMFLDPPYLPSTCNTKQYRCTTTEQEHEELLKEIVKNPAQIMICGNASEMYQDYLHSWTRLPLHSPTQYGKYRTEYVWMNYNTFHQPSLFDLI